MLHVHVLIFFSFGQTPVESITPQGGPASARRTPPQQQQRGGGGRDRDEDEEDGGDVEAEDEDEEDLLEAAVDLLAAAGQKVESPHHHQGSMLRELRTLEMVPGNGHMDRLDPTQQEDIDVSGSGDEESVPHLGSPIFDTFLECLCVMHEVYRALLLLVQ